MKKLIILIAVIIIFFIFFLFMYFSPRTYEKTYKIKEIEVTEKFDKEKKYYYFNFLYKKNNYEYAVVSKYVNKRNLIKDIKIKTKAKSVCIIPKSDYLKTYPICYNGKEFIVQELSGIKFDKNKINLINDSYKDININYLNENTFLIWNYKGFNFINEKENKAINFLYKDVYKVDLISQVNNYILVPNYDDDYSFKKMYVINTKNGSVKEWELKYEIYFDSYIVGVDKKSVFIFDNKNEIEYELRPDKMKMRKIKYKAVINDKWENVSLADFNKKTTFSRKKVYNYEIINNKLYLSYLNGTNKILISNDVKDIIYGYNDSVYYLVDQKLYLYSPSQGEILLMDYFEWNFNYKNMIFVY